MHAWPLTTATFTFLYMKIIVLVLFEPRR